VSPTEILNRVASKAIARRYGLSPTLWTWLLPWRARRFQQEAIKVVSALVVATGRCHVNGDGVVNPGDPG
jgi:hypothetical protein